MEIVPDLKCAPDCFGARQALWYIACMKICVACSVCVAISAVTWHSAVLLRGNVQVYCLYAGALEQVYAVAKTIHLVEYNPLDA